MVALSRRLFVVFLALAVGIAPYVATDGLADDKTVNRNIRFGLPGPATTDPKDRDHFLIDRPQYVLSYNDKTRTPNWVCWNLIKNDIGDTQRGAFEPDVDGLPKEFARVLPRTYNG